MTGKLYEPNYKQNTKDDHPVLELWQGQQKWGFEAEFKMNVEFRLGIFQAGVLCIEQLQMKLTKLKSWQNWTCLIVEGFVT